MELFIMTRKLPDGDKQKESLYQKYQRLKLETEDLLKDLKDAKVNSIHSLINYVVLSLGSRGDG